jgi:DnaJ domain
MDIRRAFAILGLPETASPQHVRAAYRDLVKVWHPDRFAHDPPLQAKAAEQLRQINNAYQFLQDRPTSAVPPPAPASAPPPPAPPAVARRVQRVGGQRRLQLAVGVLVGVIMIVSIYGAPWSYLFPPELPDLFDPAAVMLDPSRSAGGGLDRTYVEEPVASDSASPSAATSWYASTALGLAHNVEGSWLLNGKRFTFHQGMIRAAGDSAALGFYDPSTPRTLQYRKASNVHHVVVEVVFTQLTMRWYLRDAGRRLVYEFVRAG